MPVAVFSIVSLWALPAPCSEYDPLRIDRDRFASELRRLAVAPPRIPAELRDLPDRDETSRLIVREVEEELRGAGLAVVESEVFEAAWLRHAEILGGVYDPHTGTADPERYRLAYEYTARELSHVHEVDGVVRPSIFRRSVRVGSIGRALGTLGEQLIWDGKPIPLVVSWGTAPWPQLVLATWIGIEIRDGSGLLVYDIGCPIAWSTIYMARSFEHRPAEQVYTAERIQKAIAVCLEPLASHEE